MLVFVSALALLGQHPATKGEFTYLPDHPGKAEVEKSM